jgi:hypothetical protein
LFCMMGLLTGIGLMTIKYDSLFLRAFGTY